MVTLIVTDDDGLVGEDQVVIEVVEPIELPELEVWYEFDDDVSRDSTGRHDGDVHGNIELEDGIIGNAASFNDVGDYINLGNFDLLGNRVTIAAWIDADTFQRMINDAVKTELRKHSFVQFGELGS